jgi:hypothetical protein
MSAQGRCSRFDSGPAKGRNRRLAEARDLTDGLPLITRERSFALRSLDGKVCPHLRHSLRAYLQSCLTRAIQHVNDVRHAVREGNTVELGEAPQSRSGKGLRLTRQYGAQDESALPAPRQVRSRVDGLWLRTLRDVRTTPTPVAKPDAAAPVKPMYRTPESPRKPGSFFVWHRT